MSPSSSRRRSTGRERRCWPHARFERNAEIVRLHIAEGWNLSEIGERFGITRERVRQIVAEAGQPSLTRERQRQVREVRAAERAKRVAAQAAKPYPHGTRYGFNRGCSCEECRKANREFQRTLIGKSVPRHGLSGYGNYGCRCGICKKAKAAENHVSRHLRIGRGLA